ncbi:hypothetical protein CBC_A0787 [Clostridium botulinum C str. Eklund]|nr:hypothetical protein CBC_A0787 [Clostridium botulinum C str. Eklund]NEZ50247.1 hypothetical protein [Clostridium botulinum]
MDMLYKCLECGKQEIVKAGDWKRDSRSCKYCSGHVMPIGFIGVDKARHGDRTVYFTTPRVKK